MGLTGGLAELDGKGGEICAVGENGVIVQNLGDQPVTLGPPGIKAGEGVTLKPDSDPLPIPGVYNGPVNIGDNQTSPSPLHGITPGGEGKIAYLAPG